MCMKTQARTTKCTLIEGPFTGQCPGLAIIAKIGRALLSKSHHRITMDTKPTPRSAHRFIGHLIDRQRMEGSLNGPMTRWAGAPIISAFHYVLANKRR
jgi:hypothetical protein